MHQAVNLGCVGQSSVASSSDAADAIYRTRASSSGSGGIQVWHEVMDRAVGSSWPWLWESGR